MLCNSKGRSLCPVACEKECMKIERYDIAGMRRLPRSKILIRGNLKDIDMNPLLLSDKVGFDRHNKN